MAQSFKFLGWLTMTQLIGSSLMLGYKVLKDKAYFFGKDTKTETERYILKFKTHSNNSRPNGTRHKQA